jgi:hypothetical protein
MFLINGKITLTQYFLVMLIATIGLVLVTAASYFLVYDKSTVAVLMMILSIVSIGTSAKIIGMTSHKKEF